jgi:hypothetical protein
MRTIGFFLILVLAVVIAIGSLFPGAGRLPFFATAWWFKVLGGMLFTANLVAIAISLRRQKWAALVSHLGAALLLVAVVRDTRSIEIRAELKEGETITTYEMFGAQKPPGFALTLVSFQEQGFVSRVRLDSGAVRTVAPSHPLVHRGWLLLQESYDRTDEKSLLTLLSENGETLVVETGQRFLVPGRNSEAMFDQDVVMSRDTMFRFHVYEQGSEKATGFMSRKGIVPPVLKPGVRLLDYKLGARFTSILQLVKRPGAGLAFVAFLVMLVGIALLGKGTPLGGMSPFQRS